jgi:hypothetical protein
MPYALRNADGAITSLHRDDPGRGEPLPSDHPEVIDFLGGRIRPLSDFERLDVDFVRVLEDVIEALTARNLINLTDLPENAQAKLLARRSFRERHSDHALELFGRSHDPLGGRGVI